MNEFNLHEAHETASRFTCNLLVPLPCTLRIWSRDRHNTVLFKSKLLLSHETRLVSHNTRLQRNEIETRGVSFPVSALEVLCIH